MGSPRGFGFGGCVSIKVPTGASFSRVVAPTRIRIKMNRRGRERRRARIERDEKKTMGRRPPFRAAYTGKLKNLGLRKKKNTRNARTFDFRRSDGIGFGRAPTAAKSGHSMRDGAPPRGISNRVKPHLNESVKKCGVFLKKNSPPPPTGRFRFRLLPFTRSRITACISRG